MLMAVILLRGIDFKMAAIMPTAVTTKKGEWDGKKKGYNDHRESFDDGAGFR